MKYSLIIMLVLVSGRMLSQDKLNMGVFRDSLDGKLDMSRFLIDYHGFIPMPQIITEPALGHFGLMLTPVFIKPNKVPVEDKYVPPDITAAFVGYTANKTWGFGAMRMASLPRQHLKYRVGAAYGDINMDFYRTLPEVGWQASLLPANTFLSCLALLFLPSRLPAEYWCFM
jgi:hypothetical protein